MHIKLSIYFNSMQKEYGKNFSSNKWVPDGNIDVIWKDLLRVTSSVKIMI